MFSPASFRSLFPRLQRLCVMAELLLFFAPELLAGGPKYIAGVSYFDAGVRGNPVVWAGGRVTYFVDQGELNSSIRHDEAVAMVDAAAALWNGVSTAAVQLTDGGSLAEDVSGSNAAATGGVLTAPADVLSTATSIPVAVIFDADGSVIDTIYGSGASDPTSCEFDGVRAWIDNFTIRATIAHGVILVNGLCATTSMQVEMIQFELERAFGRLMGLDYSQVNPGATSDENDKRLGWPVMQPLSGQCGNSGGECIPNSTVLRYDDIAALSRLYPVTSTNVGSFSGKVLTAANTLSIRGTISFRTGLGMQGVNVVARPLDSNSNPLYEYTVTAVSGALFNGNHGNSVTGWVDANGARLDKWGSDDSSLQGWFDLSGIPLPPGVPSADYQISFEELNALYIHDESVGPYLQGQVAPSGTLSTETLSGLTAGSAQTLNITVSDSTANDSGHAIGSESDPRLLPPGGFWRGGTGSIGQTDWLSFNVRSGRTFTIVTQALGEDGEPSEVKAMPTIGIWNATDAVGSSPAGYGPGFNGYASGETWLQATASADDAVRIGITDMRGDGRPDYAYNGWVLYADTVFPARLPSSGGAIVIHGTGFRINDTVLVGGQQATLTSISPTEITAIAPSVASGINNSADVEVDDESEYSAKAIIPGGIRYDAANGDALTLNTAPSNTVSIGVPLPFTVTALGSDLKPAGGVTVLYTVTSGTATLGCGVSTCTVTTTGDGIATMNLIATDNTWSIVTASLSSGASLQAQFRGGTAPSIAALTSRLSLAAGATIAWTVQTMVESDNLPVSGQTVVWKSATGFTLSNASATTNSAGIASNTLTVGPLSRGQTATLQACLNGSSQCVSFSAYGARPEYATLQAISGTSQTLSLRETASQIALRAYDMDGDELAGAQVSLYESLYAWQSEYPTHGVCAAAELLAQQAASGTTAVDGSIAFTPASLSGTATNLHGVASAGNSASVNISIEQHP